MQDCVKAIVRGRVQGVAYRAFVKKHALDLGLSGYAKNLANGDVEVVACGEETAIGLLLDYCRQGPPLAAVTELTRQPVGGQQAYQGFAIL